MKKRVSFTGKVPEQKLVRGFTAGFGVLFDALRFVRKNWLWHYFIIPFFLNFMLQAGLCFLAVYFVYPFLLGFLPDGAEWYYTLLQWVTGIVFVLLTIVWVVVMYSISGMVLCAPFNDSLSERVEKILVPARQFPDLSIRALVGDIWRSLRNVIKLLLLTLGINLVGLLLNFIPGVGNVLYTIVAYTSLVFFFGNQLFDCVLDRRRLPFSQKLKFSWHYRWVVFGAGTAFFLISMIPVFGFLSISLGTAGMTKVYVEKLEQALQIDGKAAKDVLA